MGQEGGMYRPTFNARRLLATAMRALWRGEKYQLEALIIDIHPLRLLKFFILVSLYTRLIRLRARIESPSPGRLTSQLPESPDGFTIYLL
jgi:hypothetical protein